jgi:CheY-like chemotaxis protein
MTPATFELLEGTLFATDAFFRMPRSPAPEGCGSAEAQRALPRVLIVDDERLVADTLTEILNSAGYHVATAYDGWTALEAASRFKPDYLLSDVLMPDMNGVELAIAMRTLHPALKIFLFSGQVGISEILLDGQRRGYQFELIAKPIHPLKLIERLRQE